MGREVGSEWGEGVSECGESVIVKWREAVAGRMRGQMVPLGRQAAAAEHALEVESLSKQNEEARRTAREASEQIAASAEEAARWSEEHRRKVMQPAGE